MAVDGPAHGRGLGERVRRYFDAEAPQEGPGRRSEPERQLRAVVDALLELAQRTPGLDVTVAIGPVGGPAARLHYTNDGLVVDRLTTRGRSRTREAVGPALAESEVVSELAALLWSGEVDTR